ncbi:hypothetical protein SEA_REDWATTLEHOG_8 [Gordonia phage RedWattleHog]|uniref:Uncharacterized protein n=1 Tax=Gordonia phage Stormageddon TaxID=2656541 RepID=A0A649VRJ3_9CAUD|nr:hypothetical protein KHQ86_gp008 [Gordonia phage Stormageddon]QGJ94871.1 hypothetical protein SEA_STORMAGEDDON_8 [Gordonia phage Stormageddon]QLF83512.1 hypothetical protein SEA_REDWATTLEHOG_8 [Gordonia phage RedWattleHog]
MSYGIFESVSTDGFDEQRRQTAATKSLDLASERVSRQFGAFLCAATDKQDFEDRVALVKPEMMKTVEAAGVMPVTGVMRKVVGRQRSAWKKAAETKRHPDETPEELWEGKGPSKDPDTGAPLRDTTKSEADWYSGVGKALQSKTAGVGSVIDKLIGDGWDILDYEPRSECYSFMKMDGDYDLFITEYSATEVAWKVQWNTGGSVIAEGRSQTLEQAAKDIYAVSGDTFTAATKSASDDNDTHSGKDLIPDDNWDGYLNERATEDTAKVKTHNFASRRTARTEDEVRKERDEVDKRLDDAIDNGGDVSGLRQKLRDLNDELSDVMREDKYGSKQAANWTDMGGGNSALSGVKAELGGGWSADIVVNSQGKASWSIYNPSDDNVQQGMADSLDEAKQAVEATFRNYNVASRRQAGSGPGGVEEWWEREQEPNWGTIGEYSLDPGGPPSSGNFSWPDEDDDTSRHGGKTAGVRVTEDGSQFRAEVTGCPCGNDHTLFGGSRSQAEGMGFDIMDDHRFAALVVANEDGSTTGDPTKPNTLNDDVLDGVEKGDESKVSDNIDTNTGDGSDSKGNKRSSRQRIAGIDEDEREFIQWLARDCDWNPQGTSELREALSEWAGQTGASADSLDYIGDMILEEPHRFSSRQPRYRAASRQRKQAATSWSKADFGPDAESEVWETTFPNGYSGEVKAMYGRVTYSVWSGGGIHIAGGTADSVEDAMHLCEQKADFYTIGSAKNADRAFEAAVLRVADVDTDYVGPEGEQTDLVDIDDSRTDPGAWDGTSTAQPTF